jgi:hypothetical protein
MLQCHRQNVHHSKLPKPGAVGYIVGLSTVNPRRRCIVTAYPLTDSADYRYSVGIHTVFVRFLDSGEICRFSGIWFMEAD